jgi:hypothetical protein
MEDALPQPELDENELCDALLAYLREHPRAMETVEGIAEWWIPRHRVRVELESLGRALQRLESLGLIERMYLGGDWLYRMKLPDVRA